VVIRKKYVVYKCSIEIEEICKRRKFIRIIMNKAEFVGNMRKICFDYFENMKNGIITWDKIIHVVPYMVVVK